MSTPAPLSVGPHSWALSAVGFRGPFLQSHHSPLTHSSCWICLWGPNQERPPSVRPCTPGWRAWKDASVEKKGMEEAKLQGATTQTGLLKYVDRHTRLLEHLFPRTCKPAVRKRGRSPIPFCEQVCQAPASQLSRLELSITKDPVLQPPVAGVLCTVVNLPALSLFATIQLPWYLGTHLLKQPFLSQLRKQEQKVSLAQ